MNEFEINEPILFADDNFQVYELKSSENINLKQLESRTILTTMKIKSDKKRIGKISGSSNADNFISVVNMPILIEEGENNIKINVYNNSYFKGISISKGDVLGTLTIS